MKINPKVQAHPRRVDDGRLTATLSPDGGRESELQTRRSRQKSDRRSQLLAAAERLMAERGFLAVRLEDIGAAAGVSGPAIYRHFPTRKRSWSSCWSASAPAAGRRLGRCHRCPDPAAALNGLIEFHLDFALGEPDPIRIQDRDLAHLPIGAQRQVRAPSGATSRSGSACCANCIRDSTRPTPG